MEVLQCQILKLNDKGKGKRNKRARTRRKERSLCSEIQGLCYQRAILSKKKLMRYAPIRMA